MKNHQILFEHEQPKTVFKTEGNQEEHYKNFIDLENYLARISKLKSTNPLFYRTESKEKNSTQQRILNLIYKDYSLSANQFVGVIETKWSHLTLLPKIFKKSDYADTEDQIDYASRDLMYLLSYAYDLKTEQQSESSFSKNQKLDFFEIFIFLFASQTLQVLEHNFYHSYEKLEENLGFVKGKIMFTQHLKENIIKKRYDRIYCQYSLFQENNIFSQIVKYVATILFRKTKVFDNKNLLRKILHLMNDIDYRTCVDTDTEQVLLNPTQKEFVPVLNYCKLFLQNSLIKFNQNDIDIFCFLLDMNALFEKFVAGFLKQHFSEYKVETQKSDKFVAEDEKQQRIFQMRHDLFLTKNNESVIVDTKYKRTDFNNKKGGISQSDIYQMVTYAIRRKCQNVVLLYPKYSGDESPPKMEYSVEDEFSGHKVHLTAFKLDLTNLPSEKNLKDIYIKDQLGSLLSKQFSS